MVTLTAIAKSPAAAGSQRRRDLGQRVWRARWAYLFISPFYLLFLAFFLYPVLFSFYLSFTEWRGLGPIKYVGLANYTRLLQDQNFAHAVTNALILFAMYVPVMLLMALALAVLLNSRRVRGYQIFRTLVFLPYVTNMVAAGFAFQILFNKQNGLFNALLGLVGLPAVAWLDSEWGARASLCILVIWAWLGYNMVLMLAGLQTIPRELTEAAHIDGAGTLQAFWHITVPLMRPIILFCAVLSTIGTFGLFTEPRSLFVATLGAGPTNAVLTPIVHIYNQAFTSFRLGSASALSYVYFLIIFVLALVQVAYTNRQEA